MIDSVNLLALHSYRCQEYMWVTLNVNFTVIQLHRHKLMDSKRIRSLKTYLQELHRIYF